MNAPAPPARRTRGGLQLAALHISEGELINRLAAYV